MSASALTDVTFDSGKWVAALASFLKRLGHTSTGIRAQEYAAPSMVRNGHYEPELKMVSALVQGAKRQPYRTELTLQGKSLRAYCSCPVGYECKHTVAVALLLAQELAALELAGTEALQEELQDVQANNREFEPGSFLKLPGVISTAAEPQAAAPYQNGQAETPVAPTVPWWRRLLSAEKPRSIEKLLEEGVKQRVIDRHGHTAWMTNMLVRDLATLKHPLQMLQQFSETLERSARLYRYRLHPRDPELEAFLKSDEAGDLVREAEVKKAEETFLQWLQSSASISHAAPRGDVSFQVRWDTIPAEGGIQRLYAQVVVNNGGRGARTRKLNGLWQLASDVESGDRDYGPAANRLLQWIVSLPQVENPYASTWSNSEDDGTQIYINDVYAWLSNPAFTNLVLWADRTPVQLHSQPAALVLGRDSAGQPQWIVEIPQETGARTAVPLPDCDLVAETTSSGFENQGRVYLRQGSTLRLLDIGIMPVDVLASIRSLPKVPVERLKRNGLGARLLRSIRSNSGSTASSPWVREVPSRPVVEVRLSSEDRIHLSALAQHDASTVFDYDFAGHWVLRPRKAENSPDESVETISQAEHVAERSNGSTVGSPNGSEQGETADLANQPSAAEALATLPRRIDVEDLENWIHHFVPPNAAHEREPAPTAIWQLNPKQLPDLLRAWANRPTGVEYRGNPPFRQLVTFRRAPRFSVKVDASEVDWLKVSVELEQEMELLSLSEVEAALNASNDSLVLLSGGRAYDRADLEAFLEQAQGLEALGLSATAGEQRLHAMQVAGAQPEALSSLQAAGGGLQELAEEARKSVQDFTGVPEAPVAEVTAGFLRPYQRTGVDFLTWSARTFGGAILADDMGLGKTLQVLATVTALQRVEQEGNGRRKGKSVRSGQPALVVCPASVAHNWQREAQRFAPELRVLVLESGAARKSHLQNISDYDLVVVNYALLRRDAEALAEQDWSIVVADEAQAIKNPQAEVTRVIKDLRARYRIALTGTPIENRLSDLWSISDFALPGYLGQMDKAIASSSDPATAARMHRLLRARLRPVLMRRLKAEVAPELPERIETRIECEMLPAQRKLYVAELKRTRMLLDGLGSDQVKGQGRIQMLAALTRLRQICCDPVLVKSDAASGKTEELVELLSNLMQAGHKVLLFSQFVRMLNHLEAQLKEKGIRTYLLTGATTRRQELVDKFENDPEPGAFLISLKAGGTGLNLTSASHVILFDPWWNPAVEAQAIDRAHRIGQDKTVVAYRLISSGTIEERIVELQEQKRSLVRNILEEDAFNRTLQRDDFKFLLAED